MDKLTHTERKIQARVRFLPPFLRPLATKMFIAFYKDYKQRISDEKNTDEVKISYPPLLVIGAENSDENNQKRQIAKDILYTQYNASCDKILHDYFINNKNNAIHKWYMYFDAYQRHFSRFRGKDVNILEVGVQNGGSARMWKHYFTHGFPNAKVQIYGVDIDSRCKEFECDEIKIFIGSQEDREFWRKLKTKIPKVDILIDDGGHTMRQQIVTFEEMFDFVKDGGVYLCEDLHTSYWKSYGGYNAQGGGQSHSEQSFIDYSKSLIDSLNAYHATKYDKLEVSDFTNSAYCISYYDSMVFIEKRKKDRRACGCAIIGDDKVALFY